MNVKELSKVKDKIAKLLALAKSDTTAAAGAAMKKAVDLMTEWGLTQSDVEIQKSDIIEGTTTFQGRMEPQWFRVLVPLAKLCDVKVWKSKDRAASHIHYMGFEVDVQIFKYFVDTILNVFEAEKEAYRLTPEYVEAMRTYGFGPVRKDFVVAFSIAVERMIYELIDAKKTQVTSDGTALVVVKTGAVNAYFAEHGPQLKKAGKVQRHQFTDSGALVAGSNAGAKVKLQHGIANI